MEGRQQIIEEGTCSDGECMRGGADMYLTVVHDPRDEGLGRSHEVEVGVWMEIVGQRDWRGAGFGSLKNRKKTLRETL